jgi:hypothetical protein
MDWLDEIEAQIDDSVPYYVPRLIAEIRRLRNPQPHKPFYITDTWLAAHASINGQGWTARQLQVLGVPWPPSKGWRQRLVGTAISNEARAAFETFGRERRTRLTGGTR